MARTLVFVLVALSTVTLWAQRAPLGDAREVLVGVVLGDEFMLPLGSYRNGSWHALSEPDPGGRTASVLAPEGRRLTLEGWATFEPTGRVIPFALKGPTVGGFHCAGLDGYRTTLPRAADTTPRRVAAASRGATLSGAQQVLAQPDDESRRTARLIVQLVQAGEADRADAREERLAKISAATRSATPVRLRQLWRFVNDGLPVENETTYYFEASKEYGDSEVRVFATGWLHRRARETTVSDLRVVVGSLNGESPAVTADVLGVLRLASPVWILRERGYEGETFVLYDGSAGGRGRLVEVSGGGC